MKRARLVAWTPTRAWLRRPWLRRQQPKIKSAERDAEKLDDEELKKTAAASPRSSAI
jgi:hypothetical protein